MRMYGWKFLKPNSHVALKSPLLDKKTPQTSFKNVGE